MLRIYNPSADEAGPDLAAMADRALASDWIVVEGGVLAMPDSLEDALEGLTSRLEPLPRAPHLSRPCDGRWVAFYCWTAK